MRIQFPPIAFLCQLYFYIYIIFLLLLCIVKSIIKLKLKLNMDTEGAIESVCINGLSV